MSDTEANDINGYASCWECQTVVPCRSMIKVKVESQRHKGHEIHAYLCRRCYDAEVLELADEQIKSKRKTPAATCGVPLAPSHDTALAAALAWAYRDKVRAARSLLRGKAVRP
jgi:hypothetical protein